MSGDQALQSSQAFGKLERGADGSVLRWHPLIDHMIDVAACFHRRLARCRSIRRAMERSAGRQLNEQDIARLAVLVFLHDVGKANSGFQAKRWKIGYRPPGR
jgi:CRISPR-associated endonuclease/helicase Cas3